MVDVRLLGPVTVQGGAAPLGTGRQCGLLAMLAGNLPPHRTDEQILLGLWGDQPPPSARNAVQVYVSGLRKVLGSKGVDVVRAGQGYSLAGTPLRVDLLDFETTLAQGRGALRGGDVARAASLLEGGLSLWQGSPFEGAADLPFAQDWGTALLSTRQAALGDLAAAQLRLGRHDDAVGTARTLVSDHPYDERGWVALATALYWSGRQSDALETCQRARELLAEELGVDPGPELAELPTLILRQELVDPAPRPTDGDEEPEPQLPPLPPSPDPFVGRDQDVKDVILRIDEGRRCVSLLGMGGIGKTTLALAVAHRLEDLGRAVAVSVLESERSADSAMERICRDLAVDPGDDPAAAIGQGPADVLVLDNVEQVAGLAQALERVVSNHPRPQFIVTSREPVGLRGEHTILVPPLTVSADDGSSPAAELFWAAAARVRPGLDHDRDREAVLGLCDLLGGIPLAIELVAGRMRTQSPAALLQRAQDQRTSLIDTRGTAQGPERQSTLRTVLEYAVASLSPPAKALLAVAGLVDGWVRQETLEMVVGAQQLDGDFIDALDDVVSHGLATVDGDGRLRALPPVRRFVREGEEHRGGEAALLRTLAELAEQAGPHLYGPGTGAAMVDLTADADAYSTVLNRGTQPGATPAAVVAASRVLIALRRYWLLSARIPQARRAVETLSGTAALADVDRARLAILGGTLAQWVGAAEAEALLSTALDEATRLGAPDDRLLVSGWCSLAAQSATYDDADTARRALQHAESTARASGDETLVALVEDLRGFVAHQLGDLEVALEATLAGLERARASGDEYDVVTLLNSAAEVLSELGRDDEAVAVADEAFDRSGRADLGYHAVYVLLIGGAVKVAAGQVALGRGNALAAMRVLRQQPEAQKSLSDGLNIVAACEAASGRDIECARLVGAAQALRKDLGLDPEGLTTSRVGLLTLPPKERLGADAWRVHTAAGAADPMGAVDRLLADA